MILTEYARLVEEPGDTGEVTTMPGTPVGNVKSPKKTALPNNINVLINYLQSPEFKTQLDNRVIQLHNSDKDTVNKTRFDKLQAIVDSGKFNTEIKEKITDLYTADVHNTFPFKKPIENMSQSLKTIKSIKIEPNANSNSTDSTENDTQSGQETQPKQISTSEVKGLESGNSENGLSTEVKDSDNVYIDKDDYTVESFDFYSDINYLTEAKGEDNALYQFDLFCGQLEKLLNAYDNQNGAGISAKHQADKASLEAGKIYTALDDAFNAKDKDKFVQILNDTLTASGYKNIAYTKILEKYPLNLLHSWAKNMGYSKLLTPDNVFLTTMNRTEFKPLFNGDQNKFSSIYNIAVNFQNDKQAYFDYLKNSKAVIYDKNLYSTIPSDRDKIILIQYDMDNKGLETTAIKDSLTRGTWKNLVKRLKARNNASSVRVKNQEAASKSSEALANNFLRGTDADKKAFFTAIGIPDNKIDSIINLLKQ